MHWKRFFNCCSTDPRYRPLTAELKVHWKRPLKVSAKPPMQLKMYDDYYTTRIRIWIGSGSVSLLSYVSRERRRHQAEVRAEGMARTGLTLLRWATWTVEDRSCSLLAILAVVDLQRHVRGTPGTLQWLESGKSGPASLLAATFLEC